MAACVGNGAFRATDPGGGVMFGHGRGCDCDNCYEAAEYSQIARLPCYAGDCGERDDGDGYTCAMGRHCPREMAREALREMMR